MAAPTSAAHDYNPDAEWTPQGPLDFGVGSDTDPWLNQDPWMREPTQDPWLVDPSGGSGQVDPRQYDIDSQWQSYRMTIGHR